MLCTSNDTRNAREHAAQCNSLRKHVRIARSRLTAHVPMVAAAAVVAAAAPPSAPRCTPAPTRRRNCQRPACTSNNSCRDMCMICHRSTMMPAHHASLCPDSSSLWTRRRTTPRPSAAGTRRTGPSQAHPCLPRTPQATQCTARHGAFTWVNENQTLTRGMPTR